MDHSLTCNYTNACLYLVSVHQMAPPHPDWGCGHLIEAYYSFIYPERMKGRVDSIPCLYVSSPQAIFVMYKFTCVFINGWSAPFYLRRWLDVWYTSVTSCFKFLLESRELGMGGVYQGLGPLGGLCPPMSQDNAVSVMRRSSPTRVLSVVVSGRVSYWPPK